MERTVTMDGVRAGRLCFTMLPQGEIKFDIVDADDFSVREFVHRVARIPRDLLPLEERT